MNDRFTFRARTARISRNGTLFTASLPAMSNEALKAKGAQLRAMRIHRRTNHDPGRLAQPIVRGWINHYGRFHRTGMIPLLQRVSTYLRRWAGKKYRRLRTHAAFGRWWTGLLDRQHGLFAQWKWVRAY